MWDLSSSNRDWTPAPCIVRWILFFPSFIYFWLHWVFVAASRFSLVVVSCGLLSSCGAWASVVVAHGLSCSMACENFPAPVPCTAKQILNHWTSREVLQTLNLVTSTKAPLSQIRPHVCGGGARLGGSLGAHWHGSLVVGLVPGFLLTVGHGVFSLPIPATATCDVTTVLTVRLPQAWSQGRGAALCAHLTPPQPAHLLGWGCRDAGQMFQWVRLPPIAWRPECLTWPLAPVAVGPSSNPVLPWLHQPIQSHQGPQDGHSTASLAAGVPAQQQQFPGKTGSENSVKGWTNQMESSVQSLSHVQLLAVPWTAACQASLSITNSWNLLKLMSIASVMPPNHLILCHPLLLHLQSFSASGSFPVSQFFASGSQSIGVSASASVLPMNIQDWFPLGLTGLISLQSKGFSRVFSNTTIKKHQFFGSQLSL